jgi:hypothetical protein
MSRLHDWLPMQLHERRFDEEAGDSPSSASVRSCRNAPSCIRVHDLY